jgi:hypothetical protein
MSMSINIPILVAINVMISKPCLSFVIIAPHHHQQQVHSRAADVSRVDGSSFLVTPLRADDGKQCNETFELAADELERLEQDFALLEALEVRNEAQIESFVDAEDQWESLEPEEQELLKSKVDLKERIDELMKEVE